MENRQLKNRAQSIQWIVDELITKIEELEKERDSFQNDFANAEDKIGELQKELDNANKTISELEDQLNTK